jgi:hypothetical protein
MKSVRTEFSQSTGNATRTIPAGLSLFRIADDGRITFERRYDVELESGVQQMWVRAMTIAN